MKRSTGLRGSKEPMQHVMNHRITHRVLAIALSACFGIWLSVGSSAWAQDTAATQQTDAAQSTTDSAAEPKLRKRLIDAATEADDWNPEYHPDAELEMRNIERKRDVEGTRGSESVDLGGRNITKKKIKKNIKH